MLEREKWDLRRQTKEATEQVNILRAQMDMKENRVKELEAELTMVRGRNKPHMGGVYNVAVELSGQIQACLCAPEGCSCLCATDALNQQHHRSGVTVYSQKQGINVRL